LDAGLPTGLTDAAAPVYQPGTDGACTPSDAGGVTAVGDAGGSACVLEDDAGATH
jgi:hypothetical protein